MSTLSISVFIVNNIQFNLAGEISDFVSFSWSDKFIGYASFELKAPASATNIGLLRAGNVIWCGGDNAALIEIIQFDQDDEGEFITVRGRTLEALLTYRVLREGLFFPNQSVSDVIYAILESNAVSNSTSQYRRIPYLSCLKNVTFGEPKSSELTPALYSNIYDAIYFLCNANNIGFKIVFNPKDKSLVFKLSVGTNRTSGDNAVILSTDSEDISPGSYYLNIQDYKNVALVIGNYDDYGTYPGNFSVTTGNTSLSGFSRQEVVINGLDVSDRDENGSVLGITEFQTRLKNRGNERLANLKSTISYDGEIRTEGGHYKYGVDYFLGDTITLIDTRLNLKIESQVTEVCDIYNGADHKQIVTVGHSYPTLYTRIKNQLL